MTDLASMDEPRDQAAAVLASLVGTWRGRGKVSLPSMAAREFDEVVRFSVRSPVSVDYWQRATAVGDGSMLHSEAGIWRVAGNGALEVSVALPGATEVSEGTIDHGAIVLASTRVGRAATGAGLVGTTRRYELRGDSISYQIELATDHVPLSGHIWADLHRSETDAAEGPQGPIHAG